MAVEDNQSESTPLAPKSSHGEQAASSAPESSERPSLNFSEYWKLIHKTHEIDKDIAARVADKPFQSGNPKVWGVLTAISNRARKRKQGLNMVLKENVHFMGGLVEDYHFRIDSPFVSREHCKIYRQTFASEDDALKSQPLVFLKDISSNGTYVNRIRYTRRDKAVQIHHGDMISFVKPLCHDLSFTFMFREGLESDASSNGVLAKSKPAEELACEIKRVKGVGVGAPEGAICLDDFRSMQLSNAELRKKLEDGGVTMDKLQNENRASIVHHRTVSQKRGLSETTEIMDDRSRWGEAEAEAGNWLVGRSNDEDDGGSDEELFKPLSEEESMSSCCPPESEEEEDDDEEEDDICSLDSNTRKIDYEDSDSEESGEEVVSELREFRLHRKHKHLSDDEREFGFGSDGLLVIESESSAIKELLVKQEDDEEEEESMGSSIPNSCSSSSSSSSQTTYFGVTAAAALYSSSLLIMRKKKRRKKSMMSSVMSSYSLHSYFGLPTEEDSKKKKNTISSVPSVQCCYYGLSINSQNKKKKKTISSVKTFQSVHSSGHDVESGDELVSTLVWPPKQAVV